MSHPYLRRGRAAKLFWLALSVFVAISLLLGCGGGAETRKGALQDVSARDLVLTLGDLPAAVEVSVTSELPITTDRAAFERFAADPARRNQDLVQWGRTLGFRREFDNANQIDRAFDLFISSEADVYRSEDGAKRAFAAEREDHISVSRLTEVSDLPSLGDQSAAFRLTPRARTEGDRATDGYIFLWRQGPALAFLRISITGGELERSLVVQLVDIADGLIARALA